MITHTFLAALALVTYHPQLSTADCSGADGNCGKCIDKEDCGTFYCTQCSYCPSSGRCTADRIASCSSTWRGYSKSCLTCKRSCPAPPPPPPCTLPSSRPDSACANVDACKKACDAVACIQGSNFHQTNARRTCECIPRDCPTYPKCGKQYCSISGSETDGHVVL
jgi:hypothetical protein